MVTKLVVVVAVLVVVVVVAAAVQLVQLHEVDRLVVVESATLMCGERLGSLNQSIILFFNQRSMGGGRSARPLDHGVLTLKALSRHEAPSRGCWRGQLVCARCNSPPPLRHCENGGGIFLYSAPLTAH